MKCRETEKIVRNVLAETGIEADVEKVEDIQAIVAAGVVSTPAVEIDGQVKIAGKVPARTTSGDSSEPDGPPVPRPPH